MTIKAIIFDLGGVLMRTSDFTPREELASRLGMRGHGLEEILFSLRFGDMAQRGEINVKPHWSNLEQILNDHRGR